jgi:predicted metalloprotease with PDZ domain
VACRQAAIARSLITLVATLGITAACAKRPALPAGSAATSSGDEPRFDIAYRIAMPAPATHLYDVQLDVGNVTTPVVRFQMPVWSPGRYARMDFARNVGRFQATTSDGQPLGWSKENGSLWRVDANGARNLRIRYKVFANDLDGTFSVLDTAHANWNGPSIFMYVVGHKPDPVRLRIDPPAGWHVINGWSERVDQLDFTFPNYDVLVDTPTEVAPAFSLDSMTVDGKLVRVMVHTNGGVKAQDGQRARFVRDVERIVRRQNQVVGFPPYPSYTFLVHIGYEGGDGMEHLTSTQVITSSPWSAGDRQLSAIGTMSHEYFHVWNVKRIRPAALGPFDYTREQYQPSLWVAEGWTQYYGEITLLRAGVVDRASYYRTLGEAIRTNLETPGRKETSARMSSFHAPFWDKSAIPTDVDRDGFFISYYTKGHGLALMLDLTIRARTNGAKSLDDVLRHLKSVAWDAPNATYYLQGRGYTEQDVEAAASAAAGADLHPWFERYVAGVEDPPFAEALSKVGLTLTARTDATSGRQYSVKENSAATAEQITLRDGWLR